jgi:hypothetical protein
MPRPDFENDFGGQENYERCKKEVEARNGERESRNA